MTQYYASIDHSTWGSIPFGGGSATKVQYGDGSSDYSADRDDILADQVYIDAEVMAGLLAGNKGSAGVQQALMAEGPSLWSDGGTVWNIDMWEWAQENVNADRSRPVALVYPAYRASISDDDENNLTTPEAGADAVAVTKSYLSDYNTHMNTILGRIDFTGKLGSNPALTWASLQISDDCLHIWWDSAPVIVTDAYVSQWGANDIIVDIGMSNEAGRTDYAFFIYASTDGVTWNAGDGWHTVDATQPYQDTNIFSLSDYLMIVLAIKYNSDWYAVQRFYKKRV